MESIHFSGPVLDYFEGDVGSNMSRQNDGSICFLQILGSSLGASHRSTDKTLITCRLVWCSNGEV
jgi:hypothetical protein